MTVSQKLNLSYKFNIILALMGCPFRTHARGLTEMRMFAYRGRAGPENVRTQKGRGLIDNPS